MAKTVIGLFDNLGDAQAAVRELAEQGIPQDDIGFMAHQRHGVPSTAYLNESEGTPPAESIVVAVAADATGRADLAAAILQRRGAADIDQRATEWKKQDWKGRFDAG